MGVGYGKLTRASKDLVARWRDTTAEWHDDNCRRFEDNYLKSLMAGVRSVEKAMAHMDEILTKVREDCE